MCIRDRAEALLYGERQRRDRVGVPRRELRGRHVGYRPADERERADGGADEDRRHGDGGGGRGVEQSRVGIVCRPRRAERGAEQEATERVARKVDAEVVATEPSDQAAEERGGEPAAVGMRERRGADEQAGEELGVARREGEVLLPGACLLYTSPSPRDGLLSRMPSSA